jgi:molybdate transport system regulatory protein
MKISARNTLRGKVGRIVPGAVNTEVDIVLDSGQTIAAVVTNKSAEALGLAAGRAVVAVVESSSVLVMTGGSDAQLSARNVLPGKVGHIHNGQVNSEVAIALPGGTTIHATITHDAVEKLGLQEGIAARAVFKASSVILGVAA